MPKRQYRNKWLTLLEGEPLIFLIVLLTLAAFYLWYFLT